MSFDMILGQINSELNILNSVVFKAGYNLVKKLEFSWKTTFGNNT